MLLVARMSIPGLLLLASFLLHQVRRFLSKAACGKAGSAAVLLTPRPGAYVVQVEVVVVAELVASLATTIEDP